MRAAGRRSTRSKAGTGKEVAAGARRVVALFCSCADSLGTDRLEHGLVIHQEATTAFASPTHHLARTSAHADMRAGHFRLRRKCQIMRMVNDTRRIRPNLDLLCSDEMKGYGPTAVVS